MPRDTSIITDNDAISKLSPNENPSTSRIAVLLSPSSHVSNSTYRPEDVPVPILGEPRPMYQDFICGFGAAVIETTITFPLNKVIFRQQLHGIAINQSVAQLRQEGLRYLYRGLLFPLMQKATSRSLMFGMYDQYRRSFECRSLNRSDGIEIRGYRYGFTSCHAAAAFMAGATEGLGLTPFERAQILMQSAKYNVEFKTSYDLLKRGLRPYGIREYYRGLSIILLRNGSTNVMFFACRDPLKSLIQRLGHFDANSLIVDFFCGAVLGASLSTFSYPLNVVKARMQSRLGGKFETPWAVLYKILKERDFSIRELYRGAALNYTRSLLTWGFTNAGYEFFQRTLFHKNG